MIDSRFKRDDDKRSRVSLLELEKSLSKNSIPLVPNEQHFVLLPETSQLRVTQYKKHHTTYMLIDDDTIDNLRARS